MHILLVADGRSPHCVGWLKGMKSIGLAVSLLSSKNLSDTEREVLSSLTDDNGVFEPTDFWNRSRPRIQRLAQRVRAFAPQPRSAPLAAPNRADVSAPRLTDRLDLRAAVNLTNRLQDVVKTTKADAVHAMRVQVEGIAAADSSTGIPLALSTWGQDLVSPACTTGVFREPTRKAISRTDMLFSDCDRDIELAPSWGLRSAVESYRVPGNFGVDVDHFPPREAKLPYRLQIAQRSSLPVVLYPRGLRTFVNSDGFVQAAMRLARDGLPAIFVGVGLEGAVDVPAALRDRVLLTGHLRHVEMLHLAACADVVVSPAWSDGTPNSILESLAAGAVPVCGKLTSLQEIENRGAHIVWCDASDPSSIAESIRAALQIAADPAIREKNSTTVRDHYSTAAARRTATAAYEALELLAHARTK